MKKRAKMGGTESDSGLETRYCLASRTASQPGSSVRERRREPEGGRERERRRGSDGCHGYVVGDASALVYLWAAGACKVGSLVEQMCARVYRNLASMASDYAFYVR